MCWQSKWGVVSAFRPGTTPKSPNATTSFTTFFRPFFCSVRGGNLQPHQATDHLHVTGIHTAPTFARFPASPFGVLGFIPLIQIPCIAVAQFMDVAVQQRPSPLAPPCRTPPAERAGASSPMPHARSPTAWKPPITPSGAMSRCPHTKSRVAAFVLADTIRSGHHPVALKWFIKRAATALQRSPLGLGQAESDCLLAAHSRSQAFESPGGPRSEERTRHRIIIPEARDHPLLAMLITETVTSLGPLSSAPGFLPERRLLANVSTRDFSRQNPEAPAYPSTDGFVSLFGTVSVSIHRQALAGLSWLSSSPPVV